MNSKKKNIKILYGLAIMLVILAAVSLFAGVSHLPFIDAVKALFGEGYPADIRIMRNIRLPRILAAIIAGAGLSISGLVMQTNLGNSMASPSTLGVSNAAVFGANLSIIAFAGGFLDLGKNAAGYSFGINPFATSFMAFLFATLSILLILALCKLKDYSPNVVVLAGVAMGAIWTAATTMLQFFATDVGISAAVIWNFGDLGRATYKTDLIMLTVVLLGSIYFSLMSWKYNALLSGDASAKSMGIDTDRLRFLSLLLSSLITAVCVSYLGIIGFVGIIAPHIVKKFMGHDHRFTVPGSLLFGSILLLFSDTVSRNLGSGSALPVGAITSLLGAPFFLWIIFSKGDKGHD